MKKILTLFVIAIITNNFYFAQMDNSGIGPGAFSYMPPPDIKIPEKSMFPDWVNKIKEPAISKDMSSGVIQNVFTQEYSLFSILKGGNIGKILNTVSTVRFNNQTKLITIKKIDGGVEKYSIISPPENSQTSSGNSYMTVLTQGGKYQFYFVFFGHKLMVINKTTKNGFVLYK
ncbi:hypothetical protein [Elizabethkingia anophelis]|uniref:hypothetical protein n=1 Tax=Elizabethkingia anophelis TaxID=1117645 RepID=UPI0024E20725|nr:hypothetical protein [Elizabethkingia anophelis]CAH1149681.1 hypothetical protein EAVVTKC53_03023 [Elizabethkingia anophelis]CAI9678912.1 hypothetical protein EAVVTKC53_00820 [Elizabethkingia anophelis]